MALPSLYGLPWPRWWVRLRGRARLRAGFCPACYSSPPLPDCPICRGTYDYGAAAPDWVVANWRDRWDARDRT